MRIAASIPICEEDREWLDQLLSEIERMDVDVAWLLNNCSEETITTIKRFRKTVATYEYNGSYHNCLRNYPLEALDQLGYDWALQWDSDEIWEPKAPSKLRNVLASNPLAPMFQIKMAHLWGDDQVMTSFAAERDRIFNLKYKWVYMDKVVAGPTCLTSIKERMADLWMIHYGYSTPERRLQHKNRWDRNHGKSVGKNPYSLWKTISDPLFKPELLGYNEFISAL